MSPPHNERQGLAVDAPMEVELKLAIPLAYHARLTAHPALQGTAPQRRELLHAIYFDTPSCTLAQQHMALRVRHEGRRWIQTLKGRGDVGAGLHRRIEIEVQVKGRELELDAFGHGPLTKALHEAIHGDAPQPVFVTRFARLTRLLSPAPGVVIEASLDHGHITAAGRREPLSELELELKSGEPAALYALALALLDDCPLRVENRSKAERGYALYRNDAPAPVKAGAIALDGATPTHAAFTTVVAATLFHLQANEHGLLADDDVEYVHQARVALRRLRSAFAVFRPLADDEEARRLVAEVKWLAGALGPARDWDVFMETLFPGIAAQFPDQPGFARWRKLFDDARDEARRAAREALASPRYERLLLGMGAWLERRPLATDSNGEDTAHRPIETFAAEVLADRYKRVRKRGRKLAKRTPAELHRLRIAVKKLRYGLSFFASLYPKAESERMLATLAKLQDALGAVNDAATVDRLLDGATPMRLAAPLAEARGLLRGWSAGHGSALQAAVRPLWKEFRALDVPW